MASTSCCPSSCCSTAESWSSRTARPKIADLSEALPVPGWLPLLSKCGALVAVIAVFLGAGVLAAIAMQVIKGGAPLEPLLYLQETLLNAGYFVLLAMGSAGDTGAGQSQVHWLCLVHPAGLGSTRCWAHWDWSTACTATPRCRSWCTPTLNGYGGFVAGWLWFALYWALFAAALLIVAQGLAAARPRCRLAPALVACSGPPAWRERLGAWPPAWPASQSPEAGSTTTPMC